jgi:hypothetical protein
VGETAHSRNRIQPTALSERLDKDWYADVELCELPARQCVLLARRCRSCCRTDMETIITVGVPAQPAVVFLRHATIVGFLSRSVTNA